ncbi:MAG: ATP synthase F1 subunit epsilon [Verrucomicrobia bacterium]|nr:ATP synthase F1 subunit epsilon [Verrucomicrobiota bacterium]
MLKLEIISPKEKVFSTEAKQVVLPTESGEIGLLTGHIPMVTQLKLGALKVINDSSQEIFAIKGGFAQLVSDTISILTDEAVAASDLEASEIEQSINAVEKKLADSESASEKQSLSKRLKFYQLQESLLAQRS